MRKEIIEKFQNFSGASELQFIVYGQHKKLGEYLLERVKAVANTNTRSTQSIPIQKMIKEYQFKVFVPPLKSKKFVYDLLIDYNHSIFNCLKLNDLKDITDARI